MDTNQTVLTDKRGRFTFDEVPAGPQSLAITAEGMKNTKVTDVNVKAGHRLTLSTIAIPVVAAGAVQLEDYIVSAKKNDGVVELAPYEVQATKAQPFSSANIDLTRTEDDVLPFSVYTAREIEQSGSMSVGEFFRDRMSQSFATAIAAESLLGGSGVDPASNRDSLNLANGAGGRLGVDELVILVDGRRLPTRYQGTSGYSSRAQADYNAIPIASIERIEMLSSAASAIYGSGATGGVINIITKTNYRGGSTNLSYETPTDVHAAKRSAEVYYGAPITRAVSVRFGYAYRDTTPITFGERRDVTLNRWTRNVMQRRPQQIANGLPLGATPNFTTFGQGLFGPGTPSIVTVPAGYAGDQGIAPFLAVAGKFNLEMADGGSGGFYGANSRMGATTSNESVNIGLDAAIQRDWRMTAEYRNSKNIEKSLPHFDNPFGSPFFVSGSAPTNPFGVDVYFVAYDPRLELPELTRNSKSIADQVTLSLRGQQNEIRAIFDVSYTRETDAQTMYRFQGPAGSGFQLFETAIQNGIYNPFVDMRTTAPASESFYREYEQYRALNGGTTETYQVSAKISAPLFGMPAGPFHATTGVEWLGQERATAYAREYFSLNSRTERGGQTNVYDPATSLFDSDSYSAYAEAVAPILGPNNSIPLIKRLEFFASARISLQEIRGNEFVSAIEQAGVDESTGGNLVTTIYNVRPRGYSTKPYVYAFGFRYDIFDGVCLRGSYSGGFKPPEFSSIIPAQPNTTSLSVIDRKNGQPIVLSPTMWVGGGNPELDPETTDSTNFGLILAPKWLKGVRISADYVENRRDTAIVSLSVQDVLDLESSASAIAGRVQRSAGGEIVFVDARNINFASIVSKTADFSIEKRVDNVFGGTVVLTGTATKNISFKIQTSVRDNPVEQVRNPSARAFFPVEWNANVQLRWEGERWTIGWGTRLFDDVLVPPSSYLVQGNDRIERDYEHSAFVSYRTPGPTKRNLKGWLLRDLSVSLGIKNIMDRDPRFDATAQYVGYFRGDSVYGRSMWLQVRKGF